MRQNYTLPMAFIEKHKMDNNTESNKTFSDFLFGNIHNEQKKTLNGELKCLKNSINL